MEWLAPASAQTVFDAPPRTPRQPVGHTDLDAQAAAALQTRMVIGQAVGILMARDGLSSERAFALLVDTSQRTNTKLRDIAERLVAQVDDQNRTR